MNDSILKGKNVVLGITGGIAAYKSIDLISRLKKCGAEVDVILTENSLKFVTPLTVQTMSQNVVNIDMFETVDTWSTKHISLAKKADIIVIAPATANIIGKIANGIADDFLTTVVMASRSKIALAPAMNTEMYNNRFFKENLSKLENSGYYIISPDEGLLACGDVGVGKMEEPIKIIEHLEFNLTQKDLIGKKIIITAGPTVEHLDPVRYITNKSSGKMGYAISKEASYRGADTILISGPTNLKTPLGVKRIDVESTREMMEAIDKYFDDADCLIKSAAPSDFRPAVYADKKIKKTDSKEELSIDLVENPDIAAYFGAKKGNKKIIGFAAETNDFVKNATKKITKKNLDFIVLNDVTSPGAGFNVDTNIVTLIFPDGKELRQPLMTKNNVAKVILDEYLKL